MSEKQEKELNENKNKNINEKMEEINKEKISQEESKKEIEDAINEQQLEELLLQGKILFNEFKLEEAQSKFHEALVKGIKFYKSEIAEELARFYYSYGNTLLAKIEQSSDFLGDDAKKATNDKDEESKQVVDGVCIQEEKENAKEQKINNENDDDIEIAWNNLEVARILTEKQLEQFKSSNDSNEKEKIEIQKNLSRIKLRQGDLEALNDNFDNAIKEYNECLKLRMQFDNIETSRELAEIYFLLGNTNLYKNEKTSEEQALQYFSKATNCLQNLLEKELNAQGQLFTQKDKSFKGQAINREPLKDSFLDTSTTKELKEILSMMYDKIEDTLAQLSEKEQFEKEKQLALFTSQGFAQPTKAEEKKVINLGVIKGTGGQKKVVIPTPLQKEQNAEQEKKEVAESGEDGFPVKKLKLE